MARTSTDVPVSIDRSPMLAGSSCALRETVCLLAQQFDRCLVSAGQCGGDAVKNAGHLAGRSLTSVATAASSGVAAGVLPAESEVRPDATSIVRSRARRSRRRVPAGTCR